MRNSRMRSPAGTRQRVAGHRGLGARSTFEAEPRNPWPIRAAVIGAIATLLASLGGLYFSAQAARQATEQASQAQAAQTSERFTRSVEQLGSESIAVRIGAVYSFARLMRDSESDQQAIVEILSTFVRLQAGEVQLPDGIGKTRSAPVDLKAALKVLNEFEISNHPDSPAILLSQGELSKFDFRGVVLSSADLFRADLSFADLTGVDLTAAELGGANLTGAHLTNADLTQGGLMQADLTKADLTYGKLVHGDLFGAHLTGARLSRADLGFADLRYADLTGADLRGAYLTNTKLAAADLSHGNLTGAYLRGADLTGADLTGADLTNVTCSDTTKWRKGFSSAPQCK